MSRHRTGLGGLNRICKMWADERFVQGEKNTGGKGRERSFQVKQHPTGTIGSTGDIFFNTEPGQFKTLRKRSFLVLTTAQLKK